ncbi:PEGA domain-containing protein [Pseudomonas sp. PDM18]|uniref:PEGA domain-containing protein n=1 Tax=unclassified Pseudomonas TaxID=196821 RepID=UPI00177F98BD|nr:PEGA domain-containing protein [Pseudomonas sp. PDM18]MBD9680722.1 PEGA domain-containing protein [Pseudomonas sp. PDM18]
MNGLLIVGVAACVLLAALWKAGTFDNTFVAPADHEPSIQPPAQAQSMDNREESTVTVTQEPMDDEPALPTFSEPELDELPAPAAYERQLSPDDAAVTQVAPATPSIEKPTPVPATGPSSAKDSARRQVERKQPTPPSPADTVRTIPSDTAAIARTRPTSPEKPRNTPAPATFGTLIVGVQPWAEVWIDGRKRGISPPLFTLQLPPGLYTVELRNPDLPSYSQKVQIAAGQSVTLRHSFQ